MSFERTDEDVVLTSGRVIASGAEYARRSLACQLRTEALLERLVAALEAQGATPAPAPLPPESAPMGETTAPPRPKRANAPRS